MIRRGNERTSLGNHHGYIWLSAHWLGSCHQRPGCQGNRPLSPPVLICFLLLSTLCCALTLPQYPCLSLFKGQVQTSCACIYVYVCMCAHMSVGVYNCMNVFVCVCALTVCLCHAEWPLSPLVMDYDKNKDEVHPSIYYLFKRSWDTFAVIWH